MDNGVITQVKGTVDEGPIVAALNDANKQAAETSKKRMSGFTAGMNLPPGMNLPF